MKRNNFLKAITIAAAIFISQYTLAQMGKLSLEDCRRMALKENKRIKAAQLQIDAAKAAKEGAMLNSKPSIDLSATGAHLGSPLDQLLPANLLSASVDVKQPIYQGGKIKLGQQAASKVVEVYQARAAMTESEVLLSVEKSYWQVVQAKEKINLAEKYKVNVTALRTDLKNQVDAGLTYKNDQLRSEVNLNQAELNIVKANDNFLLAKLNLAQVIGQPGNADLNITDSINGGFDPLVQQSFENAADKRPEILMMKKMIEADKIQSKIIRADLKPTLSVSVSGINSLGKKVNFSNGKDYMASYYAAATLSVPIFDWGRNSKKVKEQNLKILASQVSLEQNKELISLEAQNAYVQLNQSVKNINLSAKSLEQADENLRLANDRFKAGTIVGKDVLEAQVIWQQAYTDIIDAKVDYKINMANYKKAIGELK
jgi:outer membrane protein